MTLGYTKIYAPMSGTVASVAIKQGQTINSVQQAPTMLRIADLDTMTVWTQVSEADVPKLKVGMPAYFTTLGDPGTRWTGKLAQIQPTPTVTNNVVLYTATFDVANPDNDADDADDGASVLRHRIGARRYDRADHGSGARPLRAAEPLPVDAGHERNGRCSCAGVARAHAQAAQTPANVTVWRSAIACSGRRCIGPALGPVAIRSLRAAKPQARKSRQAQEQHRFSAAGATVRYGRAAGEAAVNKPERIAGRRIPAQAADLAARCRRDIRHRRWRSAGARAARRFAGHLSGRVRRHHGRNPAPARRR